MLPWDHGDPSVHWSFQEDWRMGGLCVVNRGIYLPEVRIVGALDNAGR